MLKVNKNWKNYEESSLNSPFAATKELLQMVVVKLLFDLPQIFLTGEKIFNHLKGGSGQVWVMSFSSSAARF